MHKTPVGYEEVKLRRLNSKGNAEYIYQMGVTEAFPGI